MAKKQLRVTVDGQLIVAPIFNLDDMSWSETALGCPYCKLYSQIRPKVDVVQFGIEGVDTVHTVTECFYCGKLFALKYVNTQEVIE